MCHSFLEDASFWASLHQIDLDIARQVQRQGCPHCGGTLHSARYPRKPRGVCRAVLGAEFQWRESFCCASPDCRRRCTPPSLRFMGRKVYLGLVLTYLSSLEQSLVGAPRQRMIETALVSVQTLHRWRHWWQVCVPGTRTWKSVRARFTPPLPTNALPGALIDRISASTLARRVRQATAVLLPLSTGSCAHWIRLKAGPQKM